MAFIIYVLQNPLALKFGGFVFWLFPSITSRTLECTANVILCACISLTQVPQGTGCSPFCFSTCGWILGGRYQTRKVCYAYTHLKGLAAQLGLQLTREVSIFNNGFFLQQCGGVLCSSQQSFLLSCF